MSGDATAKENVINGPGEKNERPCDPCMGVNWSLEHPPSFRSSPCNSFDTDGLIDFLGYPIKREKRIRRTSHGSQWIGMKGDWHLDRRPEQTSAREIPAFPLYVDC